MKNIFKKLKFSTKIFVIASLLALVLFVLLGNIFIFSGDDEVLLVDKDNMPDKYYLRDLNNNNPYITNTPSLEDLLTGPIITTRDPITGDKKAKVAIVHFSDFECLYCQKQEQVLKEVIVKYKGKVKLIWKDFPERKKDSVSYQAAIAARCAEEQDKFWPYHDFLFEFSNNLNQETFEKIVDILKLDKKEFLECQNSERPRALIDDNIDEAYALDINGLPFTYVNNQEIFGEINQEDLERIINIELNKE